MSGNELKAALSMDECFAELARLVGEGCKDSVKSDAYPLNVGAKVLARVRPLVERIRLQQYDAEVAASRARAPDCFELTADQAQHVLDVLRDANVTHCVECEPIQADLENWLKRF